MKDTTEQIEDLRENFRERYGHFPDAIYFCPGRVNLIGEHLDYNGGHVLPAAISRGTYALVTRNNSTEIKLASVEEEESMAFDAAAVPERARHGSWLNYPLGVFAELADRPGDHCGLEILYSTTLPRGAGLSSSAALEVVTGWLVAAERRFPLDKSWRTELALLSQRAEHKYAGVACGIMDQLAVSVGEAHSALYMDCRDLSYDPIFIPTGELQLVVMDTSKRRELSESRYNARRKECEEALRILRQLKPMAALTDALLSDLEHLRDPILFRRARHVVRENLRVKHAADLLRKGDLNAFAALLPESHRSLRDDFEVSGFELDTIVELALNEACCAGARMTGAGFAGCAIAFVQTAMVYSFIENVSRNYSAVTDLTPNIFAVDIVGGVDRIATA